MNITENAAKEIHKILISKDKSPENTYLRVGIAGVSCSGPVYSFSLDQNFDEANDNLVEQNGLRLVVEKTHTQALESITIDYAEIEDRKGFTFTNPLAVLGGGCGSGGCGSGGCSSR